MFPSVQIVVLHTVKYRDSGVVIQGYSDCGGRQSFFLRNVKGPKNCAVISQLHPLSIIDAQISRGCKGEMKTIKEFAPAYSLPGIRCDLQKSTMALFISELIYRTVKEVEQNRELYNFITGSILSLEKFIDGFVNFHLFFTVELCKHIGYNPLLSENTLSEKNSLILAAILNNKESQPCNLSISGDERYSFIKEMLGYLSYHAGYQVEVHALDVLHEVYGLD